MASSPGTDIEISFNFELPEDREHPFTQPVYVYQRLRSSASWPECLFRCPEWLHVRKEEEPRKIPNPPLTHLDCLAPDFYVKPAQGNVHGTAQPRPIFLPRNLFCYGIGRATSLGMLDVSNLTLLFQSEWFTVFRYCSPSEVCIIK